MSGIPNLPGPSSLLVAQMISLNKGQEISANNTTERQEQTRKLTNKLLVERQSQQQQKTEDASRGFLA